MGRQDQKKDLEQLYKNRQHFVYHFYIKDLECNMDDLDNLL